MQIVSSRCLMMPLREKTSECDDLHYNLVRLITLEERLKSFLSFRNMSET